MAVMITDSWQRIEKWLQVKMPWSYERLAPPASQVALDQLAGLIGLPLPRDLQESYFIHNGMIEEHIWMRGRGSFYGLRPDGFLYESETFCDIPQMSRLWQYQAQTNLPCDDTMICDVVGPVRPDCRGATLLPLAQGTNIAYYMDFNPATGGAIGQIIRYRPGDIKATVVAQSYGEWLSTLATLLELGVYVYCTRDGEEGLRTVKAVADSMEYSIRTPEERSEYERLRSIQNRIESTKVGHTIS
jgi:molybdopterin molybdotransferase